MASFRLFLLYPAGLKPLGVQYTNNPTNPFTIFEHQNRSHEGSELRKFPDLNDLEALKL